MNQIPSGMGIETDPKKSQNYHWTFLVSCINFDHSIKLQRNQNWLDIGSKMSQTERREEPRNQNTNREKRGTKKPEY